MTDIHLENIDGVFQHLFAFSSGNFFTLASLCDFESELVELRRRLPELNALLLTAEGINPERNRLIKLRNEELFPILSLSKFMKLDLSVKWALTDLPKVPSAIDAVIHANPPVRLQIVTAFAAFGSSTKASNAGQQRSFSLRLLAHQGYLEGAGPFVKDGDTIKPIRSGWYGDEGREAVRSALINAILLKKQSKYEGLSLLINGANFEELASDDSASWQEILYNEVSDSPFKELYLVTSSRIFSASHEMSS